MPRYFVPSDQISGKTVTLIGDNAHHLFSVLRVKPGEVIEVCDGAGTDYFCRIVAADRAKVEAEILRIQPSQSEPKTQLTLYQGLPKADKMEWILQKCTELGAVRFVPVITEHTVVRLTDKDGAKKRERWQKIAQAAAQQAGRGIVPEVAAVQTFRQALAEAEGLDLCLFAYEKEQEHTLRQEIQGFAGRRIGCFIGPEGGFSPAEAELARQSGAKPITLGRRILRTETAGMAITAIMLDRLEGEEE
ncbi:MAG TPA: 16S rRNA (uracil(1498)-N(3))-methyltransferase [Firmicutes bacterium]|nr:16S rRNA (uracil(1498)-N(3))-methyltransferase [Bacillota bacterium]